MDTRNRTPEALLRRIIGTVLAQPDGSHIQRALTQAGITTHTDLLSLTFDDVNTLVYDDITPPEGEAQEGEAPQPRQNIPLLLNEKSLLKCFKAFVNHHQDEGTDMDSGWWWSIAKSAFDTFRISPECSARISSNPSNPTLLPRNQQPAVDRDILVWDKGVKRDPSIFEPIKNESNWVSWNRAFLAHVYAQQVDNIIDPNYVPTPSKVPLFTRQQDYVYSILNRVLQTDKGKDIIRKYQATRDAQRVYKEFKDHCEKSTKASIDRDAILTYLTTARLGDGNWKGSTTSFILHWVDKVRSYEMDASGAADRLSAQQKLTMLQNAVAPIDDLRIIKTTADTIKASGMQSNDETPFETYLSLLQSAAQTYDSEQANRGGTARRRQVMSHDVFIDDADDEVIYDIDTPLQVFQANTRPTRRPMRNPNGTSNQRTDRPRLRHDQWKDLGKSARETWDTLDDDDKRVILRYVSRDSTPIGPAVEAYAHQLIDTFGNDDIVDYIQTYAHQFQIAKVDTHNNSLPPGDTRRLLSTPTADKSRSVNIHLRYDVSKHDTRSRGALIDRGANGGIGGKDVRIIHMLPGSVEIEGADQHRFERKIGVVGGVVQTHRGEAIAIWHNYAIDNKGKSIHAVTPMESFGTEVHDRSSLLPGGLQRIVTMEGYIIPIDIIRGLPYIQSRPYTDVEWESLPHILMNSPDEWDPSTLDKTLTDDDTFYDATSESLDTPIQLAPHFDEVGNYTERHIVNEVQFRAIGNDHEGDTSCYQDVDILLYEAFDTRVERKSPDYSLLRPHFLWQSVETIKRTFEATTQLARIPMSTHLRKWFKSPNPAINIPRRHEPVATDTVYADTPAVDTNGVTAAQFFVGTKSLVCDVYPMNTEKQFPNTLEDNIRTRGAMEKLISDSAQVEKSTRVKDLLRMYGIQDWQSEAYMQHQNPAERRWQTVKTTSNTVLDRSGAPDYTWLLVLAYVCYILNHTAVASLDWRTPIQVLTGSTPDISILLRFTFWEPVYFRMDDSDFPSESRELRGHFVGFSEHVGHALTYKVLTEDTLRIVHRSAIRSAVNTSDRNLRLDTIDGESTTTDAPEVIKTKGPPSLKFSIPPDDGSSQSPSSKIIDIDYDPTYVQTETPPGTIDIIGRSILIDQEDGTKIRARIQRLADDQQDIPPETQKYIISLKDSDLEELMTYQQILDHINDGYESERLWKFRRITAHEGPLRPNDKSYKGSMWNVMIEWENGEITTEPLSIIAADDPVTCAIYAKDHDLLELEGWKRFKNIARRHKKMFRMANQAKLRSYRSTPKYMYGIEIPRDYKHAIELDRRNGNNKWYDATLLEKQQLFEYETFVDIGKHKPPPPGYKKIRVHLVYAAKHDGRYKARMVADGHLTDIPIDSVYSGVVSLRGLRLVTFLSELNGLKLWATDIGNAYLEAYTQEKVCIRAGPEFGELEGHTLLISKALYGLRSSGLRWHEKFADCLRDQGFTPCRAEPDIWMREGNNVYEYIAVYVDDLALAMHDPESFLDILKKKYKFKLKGSGPITFHLGCDFFRDEHNTLCMSPKKYLERIADSYTRFFGERPKLNVWSPLEKGDHPELDTSELLDDEGISQYQSLVGSLQWAISLGRFDIATAVMSLSSYRSAPRIGHLNRVKRIVCYLMRFSEGTIRFRTGIPDYSDLPQRDPAWDTSIYGDEKEPIPHDAPRPLGKPVIITEFTDANLYHDWVTGKAVTGNLEFINKTPLDWFTKKQGTVESATFGSEFVGTRITTDRTIDMRLTLRYMGVPISGPSIIFGDNESVVNSASRVDGKLHKRHNMLSYHKVRECISKSIIAYHHIPGSINPADILSKHWGYSDVWTTLRTILFWAGDTMEVPDTRVPASSS